MWSRISLYVIAALLLGAHFLRSGDLLLVILCAAAPLLFLYRKRASLLVLQAAAYCAAATWLLVAWQLIDMRKQLGQPWTAAALILGAVAALTVAAGLLLNSRVMREKYA